MIQRDQLDSCGILKVTVRVRSLRRSRASSLINMDSARYLKSYGWTHGEPLRKGGLRKPILVKHKKDTKGLGHNVDDQEAWWERVFDGQLKSLDVNSEGKNGISFTQGEIKPSGISQNVSPLYRMFVRGGVLEGSMQSSSLKSTPIPDSTGSTKKRSKRKRDSDDETLQKSQVSKSKKSSKKEKKSKRKEKRDTQHEEDWIRQMVLNMKAEQVEVVA